jgi:proton glutamate symport protein
MVKNAKLKQGKRLSLHHKILLGMLLGIPFGLFMRKLPFLMDNIEWVRLPGELFLNLIIMIVIPLVFSSVLAGTASLGDIKKLGRIGGRTIVYYIATTTIAISIGLIVVNIVKPGSYVDETARNELVRQYEGEVGQKVILAEKKPSLLKLIEDIVPTNPFRSLSGINKDVDGNIVQSNTMLQIIFFAVLMGVAVTMVKEKNRKVMIDFFEAATEVMIVLVNLVMNIAPIGVFSLIAVVIAGLGLNFLGILLIYALTVIAGLVLHVLITYHFVLRYMIKENPISFFKNIQSVLIVAFSTSSSSATLPVSIKCAEEELKVKNEVASFVLPLGATINMDGTGLYQAVAAVFIAQVFGIQLGFTDQVTIIITATLASIGTAGVPAVGIVMLIIVLKSVNIPVEGIALILAVDRFLDMCRTVINVTGDLTATVFIDRLESGKRK